MKHPTLFLISASTLIAFVSGDASVRTSAIPQSISSISSSDNSTSYTAPNPTLTSYNTYNNEGGDDDSVNVPLTSVESGSKSNYLLTRRDLALSGVVGSIVATAALHPLDVIKVWQQSGAGQGMSMSAAGATIVRRNGVAGFYRGIGPAVGTESAASVIKFPIYEGLKGFMFANVASEFHYVGLFVCAILAAIATTVTTVPGEIIKSRLMMNGGDVWSLVTGIMKKDGVLGFYAGYSACCLRDVPFTLFQLALYDVFKQLFINVKSRYTSSKGAVDESLSQGEEIFCAAMTGGVTGFLTAPNDLLKTKLMVDGHLYNGLFDCIAKTVRTESGSFNPMALLDGAAARVAWLAPYCAIYLPVYDIMKKRVERSNGLLTKKFFGLP